MNLFIPTTDRIIYFQRLENVTYRKSDAHYHDWFELYYITQGKCNYFIDNRSYTILPGDIILIPPNVIHKTNYSSESHSRTLINCPIELIPECVRAMLTERVTVFRNTSIKSETDAILKRIASEYDSRGEFSDEALTSCLNYLFILLAREIPDVDRIKDEPNPAEKAVLYIQKRYREKISLSETARSCAVSDAHLSRSFKRHTGLTFNEYLTMFRLNRAAAMLADCQCYSIAEIAYACGFSDSNYFSNVFKKAYGVCPTAKRKEFKNG